MDKKILSDRTPLRIYMATDFNLNSYIAFSRGRY